MGLRDLYPATWLEAGDSVDIACTAVYNHWQDDETVETVCAKLSLVDIIDSIHTYELRVNQIKRLHSRMFVNVAFYRRLQNRAGVLQCILSYM